MALITCKVVGVNLTKRRTVTILGNSLMEETLNYLDGHVAWKKTKMEGRKLVGMVERIWHTSFLLVDQSSQKSFNSLARQSP